jgi:TM2 domain-containing membrane protein YozV
MNNALKGALLSGLVFPGTGHFALKQRKRGLFFLIPALAGILVILFHVIRIVLVFKEAFDPSSAAIDPSQVMATAERITDQLNLTSFNVPSILFFFAWLFSILDSYFIGQKLDSMKNEPPELPL